uniref:Uncharacterized protein n=2 Tax=Anopheles merus TaxID=30066 RepID=A0A182UQ36_ANOME
MKDAMSIGKPPRRMPPTNGGGSLLPGRSSSNEKRETRKIKRVGFASFLF